VQDLTVPLGDFSPSAPNWASDLATIAGQPQSLVIAVAHNNGHGGVFVYDNATVRPTSVPTNPAQVFEYPRWLVPAATAGTFISQSYGPSVPKVNNMELLTLGAGGISTTGSTASASGLIIGTKPQRAGTNLYTFDGKILDATTGALLGTLPGLGSTTPYAALADEAHGRVFIWTVVNQREMILSYDAATLKLLAYAAVYPGSNSPTGYVGKSMALWGSDGVALTTGSELILLSGPFFTTYRGEPTQ
jgi:hypothetical protein